MKKVIIALLLSGSISSLMAMSPSQRKALETELAQQEQLLNNVGPMMKKQIQNRIADIKAQLGGSDLSSRLEVLQRELAQQKESLKKAGAAMKQQIQKRINQLEYDITHLR